MESTLATSVIRGMAPDRGDCNGHNDPGKQCSARFDVKILLFDSLGIRHGQCNGLQQPAVYRFSQASTLFGGRAAQEWRMVAS